MASDLKNTLLNSIKGKSCQRDFGPWRLVIKAAIGNADAVGFTSDSEDLLVVSSNGQSVFDCISGTKIYRNREQDGYSPMELQAHRLDKDQSPNLRMSGLAGGGLLSVTHDGWTVESLQLEWPETHCIVQPPNASIYFLQSKWAEFGKDASYHLVGQMQKMPMVFGFSWSGKSLVLCDSSDLFVWSRVET